MASAIYGVLYFLVISFCLTLFTLVLCFVVYLHHKHKTLDHIPGPKRDGFFWGNIKEMERLKKAYGYRSGVEILNHLCREYGPVMVLWVFHIPIVYISDAELTKKVLITSNYPKDSWAYDKLAYIFGERFLGKGLVTETDHGKWKEKRVALNPAFHRKYLKEFMEQFNASCDVLLARLAKLADGKTDVLMADEFNRITLDIIGKVSYRAIFAPPLACFWGLGTSCIKYNIRQNCQHLAFKGAFLWDDDQDQCSKITRIMDYQINR